MEFVKRFEGPVGMRKRVYRFGKQNDWQFSGGVFVTFDTRDNALRLVFLFFFSIGSAVPKTILNFKIHLLIQLLITSQIEII